MNRRYEVAAYYFPGYHSDPRCDQWHGQGWTEWELVKRAEPRFPGHRQPNVPAWGFEDESDPLAMARKIDSAADHGLAAFLFDWYWHEDGPFLSGALDRGFLGAANNRRLRFALMWANHDWIDIHPMKRGTQHTVLIPGTVSRRAFEAATDHIVATYMSHPAYWRVSGGPYFSFYELMTLVAGLGGVQETRDALESFRRKVRSAGLGELHLNAVVWGIRILPGEHEMRDPKELLARLGFNSVTSYVWIHHTPMRTFPTVPYPAYAREAEADWQNFCGQYGLPYFPNVTMGWDSSPRTVQSDRYDSLGYPFGPALAGNTPEEFGHALEGAKAFLDHGGADPSVLTINAWNEWTEGSYLEPDTVHGTAYLEAIRRVFGSAPIAVPAERLSQGGSAALQCPGQ